MIILIILNYIYSSCNFFQHWHGKASTIELDPTVSEDVGTTGMATTRLPENEYFYISTNEWLSPLSECILIWCSCSTKAEICKL